MTEAIAFENAFRGAQAARYELSPEDLLAADKAGAGARAGSDRHLPFASGLRCVFFENRSGEFVSLVFVCRAFD